MEKEKLQLTDFQFWGLAIGCTVFGVLAGIFIGGGMISDEYKNAVCFPKPGNYTDTELSAYFVCLDKRRLALVCPATFMKTGGMHDVDLLNFTQNITSIPSNSTAGFKTIFNR